jgi:hypothetical protein
MEMPKLDFFELGNEVGAASDASLWTVVKLIFVTSDSEEEVLSKMETIIHQLRSHVDDCLAYGGNPFNDKRTIEEYEKEMYAVSESALHVAHLKEDQNGRS